MKPDNERQPKTAEHAAKSGREVAEKNGREKKTGSKFARDYWLGRVYRSTAPNPDGGRIELPEFWARIQHGGERRAVPLATPDRQTAARTAAKLYAAIAAKGWQAGLAEVLPGKVKSAAVPTIGEYLAAVQAAADVAPSSMKFYGQCLRNIAAAAFGIAGDETRFDYRTGGAAAWQARIDRIQLDKLTPARVQAVLNERIAAARGNPLAEQKARTSAATTLRQAKCLFSPRLKLPFAKVPNPFEGVSVKAGGIRRYQSTIDAGQLLRAAQAELADTDPEAFKVVLLGLGAGLRKAEIDNLQWQQIDSAAGKIRILTTASFAPKSDGSEGEVFVDPGLCAALDAYRPKATGLYVLESRLAARPQSPKSFRAALTFKRCYAWLRSKGVLTQKPLHTLRKEFGSLINAAAGIHAASSQLRHAQIGLTAQYYVDNRRRVAPEIGAMLAVPSESQTAAKP
jgi:integrase